MLRPVLGAFLQSFLFLAIMLGPAGAEAQVARPFVVASADPTAWSGEPSFRDPKTGQVWTPSSVGQDGKPLDPMDRAFDPSGQVVIPQSVVEQTPHVRFMGRVPISAGPTVPLVELDGLSLRAKIGKSWRAVLYMQNNSASTLAPILGCRFSNGSSTVEELRVMVPPTEGGERIGLLLFGPPSTTYVDRITCYVVSP